MEKPWLLHSDHFLSPLPPKGGSAFGLKTKQCGEPLPAIVRAVLYFVLQPQTTRTYLFNDARRGLYMITAAAGGTRPLLFRPPKTTASNQASANSQSRSRNPQRSGPV